MVRRRDEVYSRRTPEQIATIRKLKDIQYAKEYQQNKKILAYQERQDRYNKSFSGKVGRGIATGFQVIKSPTNYLNARSAMPKPYSSSNKGRFQPGNRTGGKGRPRGSYDPRYAQYGGVYGFRKVQAQQLRLQRMEALRRMTVNPQQQQILNQIERREQARRQSPESQIVPDTSGDVFLGSLNREINDAANIFD